MVKIKNLRKGRLPSVDLNHTITTCQKAKFCLYRTEQNFIE